MPLKHKKTSLWRKKQRVISCVYSVHVSKTKEKINKTKTKTNTPPPSPLIPRN